MHNTDERTEHAANVICGAMDGPHAHDTRAAGAFNASMHAFLIHEKHAQGRLDPRTNQAEAFDRMVTRAYELAEGIWPSWDGVEFTGLAPAIRMFIRYSEATYSYYRAGSTLQAVAG